MKSDNLVKTKDGQARLYAVPRAKSTWKNPEVPEMDKNFRVRFSVCGETWQERAEHYPTAAGITPALREWVKLKIAALAHKIREGEKDEWRAAITPRKAVMLDELIRVYEQNVPPGRPEYHRNTRRLRAIATETHGVDAAQIEVSEKFFNRLSALAWVRMRQEYNRRGWANGEAPADAWATLRADLKAGRLPGIDKTTVAQGNTTIQSYLRCAKAALGETARGEYLGALKLPELREWLAFSVAVPAPKGHREIPASVFARMKETLAALKESDAKLWLFIQLAAWTGARPISLRMMSDEALTVREDGSGVVLVKERKRGNPVPREVPAEVVAMAAELRLPGSILGAGSRTEARKIYLRCNHWLTACGLDDTHKSYAFRHLNAQLLRREGGRELVAAGLGHRGTAMADTYSAHDKIIPMIDPWSADRVA